MNISYKLRFPESQDCHEMWSKERKRRARESADGRSASLSSASKIPDVSEPPSLMSTTLINPISSDALTKTSTLNSITPNKQVNEKKREHLPPPPPLPSLMTAPVVVAAVPKTQHNSGDSGYHDTPPIATAATSLHNETGFTDRGIVIGSGFKPKPSKEPEKLSDYISKTSSSSIDHNIHQQQQQQHRLSSRNQINADVKLNHFTSKPLNLRNRPLDNGGRPPWPT